MSGCPRPAVLSWGLSAFSSQLIGGIVHHTKAAWEEAYKFGSPTGMLDKTLDGANAKGRAVVDMKKDWKVNYPFEKRWRDAG